MVLRDREGRMNRPTETGVGAEPVSTKLRLRMERQWVERRQQEERYTASLEALVRKYEASKGKTT